MAKHARLRGQEATLVIKKDGIPLMQIDSIQSLTVEFEMDLLIEGYLGETAQRVDSLYNNMKVSCSGHTNSSAYLELYDAIVKRAQHVAGGATRIDILGSFAFLNGDFPTIALIDVHFETPTLELGGRGEFQSFDLNGACSAYLIL